jgi:septum formation protein
MQLILASTSRYRRAMLERLAHPFEVIAPGVDEIHLPGETPLEIALRLSLAKAQAVASQADQNDWIVIGSDQTATIDGISTIGKPGSHDNAVRQLTQASGNQQTFHSGLAVIRPKTGFCEVLSIETIVQFKALTEAQIQYYLHKEKPYDCTGSAKIESLGITLIESVVCPDPTALVGLPLIALTALLQRAGLPLLAK